MFSHKRLSIRGPHGLGKTAVSALTILWFATTRDALGMHWKIVTTASAWRQVTKFLWPEVWRWSTALKWDVLCRPPFRPRHEQQGTTLKLKYGEAFGAVADDHVAIEGAHADHMLYIYDESKGIQETTFDACEGAFSGAGGDTGREALALAVSTPGEPVGRFYDIHAHKAGYEDWHARHITLAECVAAGRVSADWAAARARQWGEESAVYINRVLGEFASSDTDGIVPLAHIELANERWLAFSTRDGLPLNFEESSADTRGPLTQIGVDVARSGHDKTVLALRHGWGLHRLREFALSDTMETTGRVVGLLENSRDTTALVDVIGIGAGVVDRLREMHYNVEAFNASESTDERDFSGEIGFLNRRAAAYWKLRQLLDPTFGYSIALPPDDLLTGELVATHYKYISNGRVQIDDKDKIRAKLKRSPDRADAVAIAFSDVIRGEKTPEAVVSENDLYQ